MPFKVTVADQGPVINLLVAIRVDLAFMIEEEALEAQAQGKIAIWDEIVDTINLSFIFRKDREKTPLFKLLSRALRMSGVLPFENMRKVPDSRMTDLLKKV